MGALRCVKPPLPRLPKLPAMTMPTSVLPGAERPMPRLLALPVLALLLLASHFYRAGHWAAVLLPLGCLVLLAWRRPWVPGVLQWVLLAGTAEWLRTAAMLAQQRLALGAPWHRMAAILGVVALITALAALALRHRSVLARYAGG